MTRRNFGELAEQGHVEPLRRRETDEVEIELMYHPVSCMEERVKWLEHNFTEWSHGSADKTNQEQEDLINVRVDHSSVNRLLRKYERQPSEIPDCAKIPSYELFLMRLDDDLRECSVQTEA